MDGKIPARPRDTLPSQRRKECDRTGGSARRARLCRQRAEVFELLDDGEQADEHEFVRRRLVCLLGGAFPAAALDELRAAHARLRQFDQDTLAQVC